MTTVPEQGGATAPPTGAPGDGSGSLRRSLTTPEAVAVSIGLMAPSVAMNINPQAPAGLVGRAVPLVFLLATVGVLLVAYGFIRLTQHFNHAGSVYGFIGITLGPKLGVVAGWALLITYITYAACTITEAGLFPAHFLQSSGLWSGASWELIAAIAGVLVIVLAWAPARRATRVLLTAEGATILLIAIVAAVILARLLGNDAPAGQQFTMSVFSLPEGVGVSALFFAMTFGFLSFAGFEGAATLGEETKNPRRAIPRVLLGSVVFAGLFYTFISAITTMGFGVSAEGIEAFTSSSSLLGDLGSNYISPLVGDLVSLGAGISGFGCALACIVGGSRLLFAFTRDAFPNSLIGKASGPSGNLTGAVAVVATVTAVLVILLRVFATADPINIIFWTATVGTLSLLVAYLLVTVGAIRFLFFSGVRRVRKWEIVIPISALAVLLFTLYKSVYPVPDSPYNLFPYLVAALLLLAFVGVAFAPGMTRRIHARLLQEDGLTTTTKENA
jgi:amino acid transporter